MKPAHVILAAVAAALVPIAEHVAVAPFPRAPEPEARRTRIHRLRARTGWQFSVCRRLVDTKSAAEIEAMVRRHREKGTSP